jgi:hypothetical protein
MLLETIQIMDYCILDAAKMGDAINELKNFDIEVDSLYRGRSEEILSSVAPYLVECRYNIDFFNWYYQNGVGESWGIFIHSDVEFKVLWKHFRKFLLVMTEENKELYFRFYDPRVLRIFLPTCETPQLVEFFGPVKKFIVEDEDKNNILYFSLKNGKLEKEILGLYDTENYNISNDYNISNGTVFDKEDELNTIV